MCGRLLDFVWELCLENSCCSCVLGEGAIFLGGSFGSLVLKIHVSMGILGTLPPLRSCGLARCISVHQLDTWGNRALVGGILRWQDAKVLSEEFVVWSRYGVVVCFPTWTQEFPSQVRECNGSCPERSKVSVLASFGVLRRLRMD
eukprot:scaffold4905_cov298-Pinguiococcus_pyrenoidosus.AAC.3